MTIKKKNFNNITFIGGIHGSGKGKICKNIEKSTDLVYLTASEVLKWKEISRQEDKLVQDISQTQDLLITNLNVIIKEGKHYLLDGHYCLLNKEGMPEKIPSKTFEDIAPIKLILVTAEPAVVKERLEARDSKKYEEKFIEDFQNLEIAYARELSNKSQAPLKIINSLQFEINELLNFITCEYY